MAITHGKAGVIKVGTASSETDISAYADKVDFPPGSFDEADTTTFGAASSAKTFIPGLSESLVAMSGKWDPTLDGIMNPLRGVAGKSIVWGPAGSTTGFVKYSALGFLKSYKPSGPVGGVATWTAEFRISGVVTVGVF